MEYDRCGAVFDDGGKVAAGEKGFVEVELEHVRESRVDVDAALEMISDGEAGKRGRGNVQETRVPFEGVGVKSFSIVSSALCPPAKRLVVGVEEGQWAPIEGTTDIVYSPRKVCERG